MRHPRVNEEVIIYAPENPKLHGEKATVKRLEEWGAVLATSVGNGEFRALWEEMRPPPPKFAAPSNNSGFSGDICKYCQGSRMVRNGTCLTCTDCGETSGCS